MKEQLSDWLLMLSGFGSQKMEDIGILAFVFVMGVALLSSMLISLLYSYFYQSRSTGSQVHRAFPLLGLSITAIFICIQFSLPLSLGLLGALSIVRFRTPIKEPEEIGFIMLVIASSIACATFNLAFLFIILGIALLALVLLRLGPRVLNGVNQDGILLVTFAEQEYHAKSSALMQMLDNKLYKGHLGSISKNDGQIVISYNFARPKKQTLAEFQTELTEVIGESAFNLFFNQPGTM
ncbi:MAG: DUF4956 domain-containing protein [Candidatus Vecturithrix sp.]|jgi:hypothetical protein|nr:DUF4956 domain-containing protein [Candidatus Vecturithrix sp.]